jgi:hypothetical protein
MSEKYHLPKELGGFKKYGVTHFCIEMNAYVAHRELFKTALEFITRACDYEDCGYEIQIQYQLSNTEIAEKLLPFVKDDAYVIHRISSSHPWGSENGNWWEFVRQPSKGAVQVWYIDLKEVEKNLQGVTVK